ncbi:hypothetical protein AJ80_09432 [Polytolypa hystricis UAMH7299]|uniref:Uncharacterized protein n=1 Tax=Polytolypa hystricis (strain UAMH7299) TaxID=1447883 RepID=A0A2B7WR53_POLH7|nr:hypothetical protein AJ80_09432 [Polytolypa hystricis UAMH7299]
MAANNGNEPVTQLDPLYDIVDFTCGDKDRTELSIMCYDKRFDILAEANNMDESPAIKNEFLDFDKEPLIHG